MSDRDVAYAMGFGDPVSRRAYEKAGANGGSVSCWTPAPYSQDRRRALELLPTGEAWDRRAIGLTAIEICRLALSAKAAGHRPRRIPSTTSGQWLDGKPHRPGAGDPGRMETARAKRAAQRSISSSPIAQENWACNGKK